MMGWKIQLIISFRLSFAQRARCAAAIFLFAARLIVRLFVELAQFVIEPSRSTSLVRLSSFSLIDVARLSCCGLRWVMFRAVTYTPR
jgi:hypothetical protein